MRAPLALFTASRCSFLVFRQISKAFMPQMGPPVSLAVVVDFVLFVPFISNCAYFASTQHIFTLTCCRDMGQPRRKNPIIGKYFPTRMTHNLSTHGSRVGVLRGLGQCRELYGVMSGVVLSPKRYSPCPGPINSYRTFHPTFGPKKAQRSVI